MLKNNAYYTTKTIASWDEVAPIHDSINTSLTEDVACKNFNSLNPDFNALVDEYDVRDKSVVQVCCNNAIDLLSIKNKGASRCLGIDGSQAFIKQASSLAQYAGHTDIEFCCSDIYELPSQYNASFDIVIITVGVLSWMPDIKRFMQVCSQLLTDKGVLLIEDMHPMLSMYEEGKPSFIDASYFNKEPYRDTSGLDYFTNKKYDAKENFWFHHTLTDIFMAAIANDLHLEHIKELDYNVGNFCADLEHIDNNPALGINLGWRKTL